MARRKEKGKEERERFASSKFSFFLYDTVGIRFTDHPRWADCR